MFHVITHGAYHRGNVDRVLKGISVAPQVLKRGALHEHCRSFKLSHSRVTRPCVLCTGLDHPSARTVRVGCAVFQCGYGPHAQKAGWPTSGLELPVGFYVGLVVFVQPIRDDEVLDHTDRAMWMGAVRPLDLSVLSVGPGSLD